MNRHKSANQSAVNHGNAT